jgi:hypothetical protein
MPNHPSQSSDDFSTLVQDSGSECLVGSLIEDMWVCTYAGSRLAGRFLIGNDDSHGSRRSAIPQLCGRYFAVAGSPIVVVVGDGVLCSIVNGQWSTVNGLVSLKVLFG